MSRRSSRSYSHQSFIQYTPHGTFGYRHSTYTATDHFYTPNNMAYYQPNKEMLRNAFTVTKPVRGFLLYSNAGLESVKNNTVLHHFCVAF